MSNSRDAPSTPRAAKPWLEHFGLRCNPFAISDDDFDNPSSAFTLPSAVNAVHARKSSVLLSNEPLDRLIAASLTSNKDFDFVYSLPLPRLDVPIKGKAGSVESVLVRQAGRVWLNFLQINPRAYFDLPPVERHRLLALLQWSIGSPIVIKAHLERTETLKADFGMDLISVLTRMETGVQASPDLGAMSEWLTLRPYGMKHTLIIVETLDDERHTQLQAKALLTLVPSLNFCNVYLKVYASCSLRNLLRLGMEKYVKIDDLKWDPSHVLKLFDSRVKAAVTTNLDTADFGGLLDSDQIVPKDLVERLLNEEEGSLSRVFRRCCDAVNERIPKCDPSRPETFFLKRGDFKS